MFFKQNQLRIYLLFIFILLSIIGYNLWIIQPKEHSPIITTATITQNYPVPDTNTPTVVTPTPSPPRPQIYQSDFYDQNVKLLIPKIFIDTLVDKSETIQIDTNLTLSEPKELPVWIATWSVEPGREGLSMIYGHRQWGPNPKVFSDLDQLIVGDVIYLSTSSYIFTYVVNESVVIDPNIIWTIASAHDQKSKEAHQNELVLITCTPWGTNLQRLIIFLTLENVDVLLP